MPCKERKKNEILKVSITDKIPIRHAKQKIKNQTEFNINQSEFPPLPAPLISIIPTS